MSLFFKALRLRLFLAVVVLGIAGFRPSPAMAAMAYCNRTQTPIEAAFGHRETLDWISDGWWQLQPGECLRVFSKPLTDRFYFYFARALSTEVPDKPPFTWAGKYIFCINAKPFHIEGDGTCEARGYVSQGFAEIDIGANVRDYTLDFKDGTSPDK